MVCVVCAQAKKLHQGPWFGAHADEERYPRRARDVRRSLDHLRTLPTDRARTREAVGFSARSFPFHPFQMTTRYYCVGGKGLVAWVGGKARWGRTSSWAKIMQGEKHRLLGTGDMLPSASPPSPPLSTIGSKADVCRLEAREDKMRRERGREGPLVGFGAWVGV